VEAEEEKSKLYVKHQSCSPGFVSEAAFQRRKLMFMRCGIQNLFLVRHYKQYFSFLCCRNGRFHLGLYFKVCFIIIYIRLIPCRYVTLNVPCKIIVSFYFKGLCCHVF
jgi:hypothetical protein